MSSNAYVSLIRSIRWSMGLLYGILFHNPTLTRLKQIQLRQLVLSVRIANPWTVAASLKCSRTLNYRFLIRGESNWGSRLCSMWLRGWYQLYQPLNILKQFKINVKYVIHVIKTVNLQTLCHPMNLKTINASSTKGAALLFIQKLFLLSSSRMEPDGWFNNC